MQSKVKKLLLEITVFKAQKLALLLFIILVSFSNCVGKRKIAQMKQIVSTQKSIELKLDSTLRELSNIKNEKISKGELDDSSNIALQKVLDREARILGLLKDSISGIESTLSNKRVKRKEYKFMTAFSTNFINTTSQKSDIVNFIEQLLKQNTFIKFNTASFFPPGGYKIDSSKLSEAKVAFAPIIDSLLGFVLRFPNREMQSAIITCGYADGSGFGPGELVDMLTKNIGKLDPKKEELNQELSRLRADEISSILTSIFQEKIKNIDSLKNLNAIFYKIGKGEELPNKKITDYGVDDERRRIVLLMLA
jgi:hypothetical protein